MLSRRERIRIQRRRVLSEDLEEARQDYIWGHYTPAYLRLMRVMEEVIIEPPIDSEEYQDGERKSATPDDEQKEAENAEAEPEQEFNYKGQKPERDEDGYLIR